MNLEKIVLGELIKYKKLCEIFNEEKKYGNSKVSQMANWERYVNIIKCEKANFKIIEIYEEPKEKIDNRKGNSGGSNNQVYMQHIDPLLTSYFSNMNKKVNYVTVNQLAQYTGIINKNYRELIDDKMEFFHFLQEEENVSNLTALNNVFYSINDIIKPMVTSSLDRLVARGLIDYERNYILHENIDGEVEIRLPTPNEEEIILQCQHEALEEFNIKNESELIGKDVERKKYYKWLNELIFKSIENIERCYRGFKVIVKSEMEMKLGMEEIQNHKVELNKVVKQRVRNRNVGHRENIQKKIDKLAFGELTLEKYQEEIMRGDYFTDTEVIISYLLDLESKMVKLTKTQTATRTIKKVAIDNSPAKEVEVIELLNGQKSNLEISEEIEQEVENIVCTHVDEMEEYRELEGEYLSNRMEKSVIKMAFDVSNNKIKEVEIWKFEPKYHWQKVDFVGSKYEDDELLSYSEKTGKYEFL